MSWFFLALSAAGFFTLYSLLSRVLSIKSENPRAFSVIYNLICAIFAFGFFLLDKPVLKSPSFGVIFLTFIATLFWGLFGQFEFFAHKYVEASVLSVIMKTADIVAISVATLFLGEILTLKKILAAVLILGGNFLVLFNKKTKIKENRELIYGLLTAFSLGIAWTIDKKLTVYYPTSFYIIFSYFFPAIYVLMIPPIPFKALKREIQLASWKISLLSLVNVAGYYCLVSAFALGEASKVVLISTTRSIFIILLGISLLKERTNIPKKIIAGILVTIGILLLK